MYTQSDKVYMMSLGVYGFKRMFVLLMVRLEQLSAMILYGLAEHSINVPIPIPAVMKLRNIKSGRSRQLRAERIYL